MIVVATATPASASTRDNGASPVRGARAISPFREALLVRGHGEWAFHADGRHVRVAREAPLQLTSVSVSSSTR
jgi:hypothetical protein